MTANTSRKVLKKPRASRALLLLGEGLAGDGLEPVGEGGLHPLGQLLLTHAGLGRRSDVAVLAGQSEHLLSGGCVEHRERGAEGAVDVAEPGDAGDGELLRTGLGQDGDLVADDEALLVGGGLVHHHVGRRGRCRSRGEAERVQRGIVGPGEAERGGAAVGVADRLAALVDVLGIAGHVALGDPHAVDGLHGGQHRGVDRSPRRAEALTAGDRLGLAHDDVGAGVDVLVEAVEGRPDGGGQHEGARHEGHPDEHGDTRGRQTQLVGQQALPCHVEHGGLSARTA
jgi:hypothetical protein